jgi:hypothetical protein
MKISYRTHPRLEKLEKKDIGKFSLFEEDLADVKPHVKVFSDFFKRVALGINNQIYQITKPFSDAYEAAGDRLFESKLYDQVEDDNICFIAPWKEATCMRIRNDVAKKIITTEFVNFFDGHILSAVGSLIIDYNSYPVERTHLGWVSKNVGKTEFHIFNCILMTLFIKYADVQTKILPAKKKIDEIDCKYVNETKSRLVLLDSLWFTNLVKSDAFKVRGHFRLQPKKKEGQWTKELIWINEFQKDGYTRKAGILSQNEAS